MIVDEDQTLALALFAVGWTLGWLLLWSPRRLPSGSKTSETNAMDRTGGATLPRSPVAVIVPARNEAHGLPRLLDPLVAQRRAGDEIVVVDDHSDDGTAQVASSAGARVIGAPALPDGWLGKPHACWQGTRSTTAPILVFLDADVRPGPTLLDDLAAEVARHPDTLVSVQPWHRMESSAEQPSLLCNVAALMGCGAFTPLGDRTAATVAFGPVIAVERSTYDRTGGHATPSVRTMHTEDIGLARAIGRSRLFVGAPTGTTFRMYPSGLRELMRGWGRSIATGARYTPWWLAIATFAWIFSLAGGWIAVPAVYPLSALQVWVLGRRAGTTHALAAALFPVLVAVFVLVFARSLLAVVFRRDVTWKGRQVGARTG